MGERGIARPPRSFYRSETDARRDHRRAIVYMTVIHAALAAGMLGLTSIWIVAPVIVVCYLRGALLTHELMHVRRPERVTWILRLMMLFDTPLGLGYREHQDIHLRHHREAATRADPEYFQIEGGSARALLAAMISPELAAAQWVATRGIGASLRREAATRALLMLTLVAAEPTVFLRYWVVLRLTIGVSNFMFHHVVHYRRGEYGTFPLRLPGPLDALLRVILGPRLAAVLCEHDAHHVWRNVKAEHLRGLLLEYPAPESDPLETGR
ncbi:MAG: fatty acid desaturase [Myxococcales bacterium]|nr:fatty acid desaturase [Myxococcales bacterium]